MLIREAEIDGRAPVDVRIAGSRIESVGASLAPARDEAVLDARGGALLPGLHDHHVHLLALAAAQSSVPCGPPQVRSPEDLAAALAKPAGRAPGGWIRGVGHHESAAGPLDRARLDALVPDRPVRVQHRSGAMWVVNGAGLRALALDGVLGPDVPAGVERDAGGRATGRLFRLDAWLRPRWQASTPPDLRCVGQRLAAFGVTGVTDATPGNGTAEVAHLRAAVASGALPQRVRVMGGDAIAIVHAGTRGRAEAVVEPGERKILLEEPTLPALGDVEAWISDAHAAGRATAIHCVTRAELALAAGAFEAAGTIPGDRIEHASVAPPDLAAWLARLGLCVVTQPNFLRERGDTYLREVDAHDRPWLYRGEGLLEAGVALGGGTDAPFGDPDPWLAMRAAIERETAGGQVIGQSEALTPERALALFTSPADAPGAAPRRVAAGAEADLCLLDAPWSTARGSLSSGRVVATIARGRLVWQRGGC